MIAKEPYEWLPSKGVLEKKYGRLELIDCGFNGCAFWLKDDQPNVLKITADAAEVESINKILALRAYGHKLPGIVSFLSDPERITKYPWPDKQRKWVYGYTREGVIDLFDVETFKQPTYRRKKDHYYDLSALTILGQILEEIGKLETSKKSKKRDKTLADLDEEYEFYWAKAKSLFPEIAWTIDELKRNGLYLTDIDIGNIGITIDKRTVLFDFTSP